MDEFEETEVRRQERTDKMWKTKLNSKVEEFRRSKLPEKYIAKILFG